jgi:hypothetical protein
MRRAYAARWYTCASTSSSDKGISASQLEVAFKISSAYQQNPLQSEKLFHETDFSWCWSRQFCLLCSVAKYLYRYLVLCFTMNDRVPDPAYA